MENFIPNLNQRNILTVIEDTELQNSINNILLTMDYKVRTSSSFEDTMEYLKKEIPDLVIINFFSPALTLKLCKSIKGNSSTFNISTLAIINVEELSIKNNALFTTIDDFIKKPFCAEELLTRIKILLYKDHYYRDMNPLTNLRGISAATKELYKRIEKKDKFGVGYVDLYNLDKFNKRYGFKRGEEVIKHTGTLIYKILTDLGSPIDTSFHFGPSTFLLIISLDGVKEICEKIIEDFDNTTTSFYDERDKNQGYIMVKNREGKILKVPFLKIHIGVVTNENYPFTSPTQIIHIAMELKNYADRFEKSIYIKERRKK